MARAKRGLTERQTTILMLASEGYGAKQTARLLHLTVSSVKRSKGRIYQKLGAWNMTHAVALWLRDKYGITT